MSKYFNNYNRKPNRPTAYDIMYRRTLELIDYSYERIENFNKVQRREGMGVDIKNRLHDLLELVRMAQSYHYRDEREQLCRDIDIKTKVISSLIYLAYKQKAFNAKQLEVWQRRVKAVDDLAIGIAMGLQKRRESKV